MRIVDGYVRHHRLQRILRRHIGELFFQRQSTVWGKHVFAPDHHLNVAQNLHVSYFDAQAMFVPKIY